MTVNTYFQSGLGIGEVSEQNLVEDMMIEIIQMNGMDIKYIKRSMLSDDKFFHETPNELFMKNVTLEAYMANVSDYSGGGDFYSKFGLEVDDNVEFIISRKRFREAVGQAFSAGYNTGFTNPASAQPAEGDLIYIPLTKHLLEIKFVSDEMGTNVASFNQFYALSKQYSYSLKCSLFTYSYEKFDTGIAEVDGNPYVGVDYDMDRDREDIDEAFATNTIINNEANDYLDFSEGNPFGSTVREDE